MANTYGSIPLTFPYPYPYTMQGPGPTSQMMANLLAMGMGAWGAGRGARAAEEEALAKVLAGEMKARGEREKEERARKFTMEYLIPEKQKEAIRKGEYTMKYIKAKGEEERKTERVKAGAGKEEKVLGYMGLYDKTLGDIELMREKGITDDTAPIVEDLLNSCNSIVKKIVNLDPSLAGIYKEKKLTKSAKEYGLKDLTYEMLQAHYPDRLKFLDKYKKDGLTPHTALSKLMETEKEPAFFRPFLRKIPSIEEMERKVRGFLPSEPEYEYKLNSLAEVLASQKEQERARAKRFSELENAGYAKPEIYRLMAEEGY